MKYIIYLLFFLYQYNLTSQNVCNHNSLINELNTMGELKYFNVSNCFWKQDTIYYKILNHPKNLSFLEFKEAIQEATNSWNKSGKPYFIENKYNKKNNLYIEVDTIWRYDIDKIKYPDGINNTLAFAYLPCNNITTKMRFDVFENWNKQFVKNIALHELGHILGIDHSEKIESVMYKYYQYKSDLEIDDLEAKCALYNCDTLIKISCFNTCEEKKKFQYVSKDTCIDVKINLNKAIEYLDNNYKLYNISILKGYCNSFNYFNYHNILPLKAVDITSNTKYKKLFIKNLSKNKYVIEYLVDNYNIKSFKFRKNYIHIDLHDRKNYNAKTLKNNEYYIDIFYNTDTE